VVGIGELRSKMEFFSVPIFVNPDQISWILFVRLIGAFPLPLAVSTGIFATDDAIGISLVCSAGEDIVS